MTPKIIKLREVKYHWEIYLFLVPSLILIALFQYYPAANAAYHSFFRWNGNDINEYVGFGNYVELFQSKDFWNSFKVALILGAWNVVKMIPPVLVAVCIHRCRSSRMQFFYRTAFVIPMVIPQLVIVLIWRSFFFEPSIGFLNRFLRGTHLLNVLAWLDGLLGWGQVFVVGQTPAWLGDMNLIIFACIVWGFPWVGSFAVLTHLAKLQNIDKALYEAADLDGVNWWSKFTNIEFPMITGSIYIIMVFTIIGTITDAGTILALTGGLEGGPGGAVSVPALFMLRKAFMDQRMGSACGVGIVLMLIVVLLQKLSNAILNWHDLSRVKQISVRSGALLFAGMLFACGRFLPLALVIAAVAIPRAAIWKLMRTFSLRSLGRTSERIGVMHGKFRESILVPGAVREFSAAIRSESAAHQRKRRINDRLLRFAKHATIWSVLALAFLPLYLMLVVSGKTNQQFVLAPVRVTTPFHWENWREAWVLISPTVANSIFISTTATALILIFALCAAYFFARVKMPFSGFLWSALLVLMMIPAVANLVPLFQLLQKMSLLNTLTALILVGASAGQVFAIFVLRNFVADVPHELFEAAEIDGASHFQQMRMIVVPLAGPILGTVGVMQFLAQWNEFLLPLIVIRDQSRLPVMVSILRLAGEYIKNWGPLMAGYAIASLPIIVLFIFSMKLFIRGLTEGATKG